ncbi:Putative F-box protein At3g16210 [Linum grandiflorum]
MPLLYTSTRMRINGLVVAFTFMFLFLFAPVPSSSATNGDGAQAICSRTCIVQNCDCTITHIALKTLFYMTSSIGWKGTISYAPPEYDTANEVSVQGDVYSYGIILVELRCLQAGDQLTQNCHKVGAFIMSSEMHYWIGQPRLWIQGKTMMHWISAEHHSMTEERFEEGLSSTGGGSKGSWLPVDITVEIVKRLSTAASIGRFRCVSKSWYSLLSDPNFIRKETQLFNDHGTIDGDKRARLVIIYDAFSSAVALSYRTLEPISPVLNLADLKLGQGVGGCCECDGIFCFFQRDSASNIVLWNPTTCDYRVLPSVSQVLGSRGIEKINVGFGYDPLTNDYKVVALVEFASGGGLDDLDAYKPPSVYLYSLRNNSWKALCDFGDAYINVLLEVFQSRYSSAKIEICYWL